ncbi:ogr/Delta-like zinc finger family protein [Silanimonas lenta]|jgi:predicted RNA-binding Zn-ribbon protein involved in translation (DUF1610 family)|uniref:ogr/Delta-like zinc finger family protein n=1 Tax=Silanimonas lenta TaxID=265429 RepID=UPI0021DD2770|nr:MAG: hypothetical protein KatS3mg128_0070 [Silanimonas sp.]
MSRVLSMACPHCGSTATCRNTRTLSPLYREVTYQCRNVECGHIWVCGLEAIRTLSPSAIPAPGISIPLSPHIRQRALAAQLALEALDE